MSFCPEDVAQSIRNLIPDFEINYSPDYRQEIADGWPGSIDDTVAREDWNWKPEYDVDRMTEDMLFNLKKIKVNREI
jgi:nucleoside-diphosphate-sugar epimerase